MWFDGQQHHSILHSKVKHPASRRMECHEIWYVTLQRGLNQIGFFSGDSLSVFSGGIKIPITLIPTQGKKNRAWHKNNYMYQTQTDQWQVEVGKVFQQNNKVYFFGLYLETLNGTGGNTNKEWWTGLSSNHRIGGTISSSACPHVDVSLGNAEPWIAPDGHAESFTVGETTELFQISL